VIRRREGYPALDSDPPRLAPPLGAFDGQAYPSNALARRPLSGRPNRGADAPTQMAKLDPGR